MKVKLLFFFSFVLASAAFIQHGAKLTSVIEQQIFSMATFFVAEII